MSSVAIQRMSYLEKTVVLVLVSTTNKSRSDFPQIGMSSRNSLRDNSQIAYDPVPRMNQASYVTNH